MKFTEQNFPDAVVNCGTCTLCCKQTLVVILVEDQSGYLTNTIETPNGPVQYLQQQANGDCIYLHDNKCLIHGQHPIMCRKFSCTAAFKFYPRWKRRELIKSGQVSAAIFARGNELIKLEEKSNGGSTVHTG